MAAMESWRRACGAIKDTTTLSLANLNSDYKDLDVAIVKATNHVEAPPKDRHLRRILMATAISRPRADVAYCIHALARRLAKTRNWIVALKTLIVIHRLLRDGDPTFREELLNVTQRGRILQLSNFRDDSSPAAWDCSAWVRTYGQFLEERLECFRTLKYDVESERLVKQDQSSENGVSRMRELDSHELLKQLQALQQLMHRLVGCRPEGAANNNYLVQYALALVLKESFKIYCAINDGIINLIDKFFEMPKHEAVTALEVYRRAGQQAASLSEFYETCRGLELARNFQFPALREPPQSFITTMEEYVREAPQIVPIKESLKLEQRLLLTYKTEEEEAAPPAPVDEPEKPSDEQMQPELSIAVINPDPPPPVPEPAADVVGDLLGLNEAAPGASAIEESNALALAILPTGGTLSASSASSCDPTGWELALVTTASNGGSSAVNSQLAGGFDKLILDSLYDEAAYRQMQQQQLMYGATSAPNPFMASDPFAVSNQVAPPPSVQMSAMGHQQQHMMMMAPSNPFGAPPAGPVPNPFLDTGFGVFPAAATAPHGQQVNPFGSPQLI